MVDKKKQKNLESWVQEWVLKQTLENPDLQRDLITDVYGFKCPDCGLKFSITMPINEYMSSYQLDCPKCDFHEDKIHFFHFYRS
jgi:predicted RNA-binding Zn-ribbon protein involved in translation (DUF1610 family)